MENLLPCYSDDDDGAEDFVIFYNQAKQPTEKFLYRLTVYHDPFNQFPAPTKLVRIPAQLQYLKLSVHYYQFDF